MTKTPQNLKAPKKPTPKKPTPKTRASKKAVPAPKVQKIPPSNIPANIDWQASVLAEKVQRRVMSLEDATRELEDWQDDEAIAADTRVASRALIVTHMLNAILKRGY
jgi:hypothetical protein